MKVCNIKAKVTIHSWENMKKKKKKNFNHVLFKKKKGKKKKKIVYRLHIYIMKVYVFMYNREF